MFDKKLEDLFKQYKTFKKNLDLNFEFSKRPELTGKFFLVLPLSVRNFVSISHRLRHPFSGPSRFLILFK